MVGLPARGKTYISKKLTRYLNWIGVPTKGEASATARLVNWSAVVLLANPCNRLNGCWDLPCGAPLGLACPLWL